MGLPRGALSGVGAYGDTVLSDKKSGWCWEEGQGQLDSGGRRSGGQVRSVQEERGDQALAQERGGAAA